MRNTKRQCRRPCTCPTSYLGLSSAVSSPHCSRPTRELSTISARCWDWIPVAAERDESVYDLLDQAMMEGTPGAGGIVQETVGTQKRN